jgi:PrtD family type I secretion system ABC transporter
MREKSELSKALMSSFDAFAAIGCFSFIMNLGLLVSPLYMMQIYNRVLPTQSTPTLYALTGLACFLVAVMAILEFIRSRILIQVSVRLDKAMNDRVLHATFMGTLTGSRPNSAQPMRDLDTVRQFVGGSGTLVFFDMPWTPILIAVIYVCHPVLGILTTIGAVILFLLAVVNELATRYPLEESNRRSTGVIGFIGGSLRNAEALHAMGMFNNLRRHRAPQQDDVLYLQTVASNRASLLTAVSKAFRQILQIALLGVGAYLAVHNEITGGEIIAASLIAGRALAPLEMTIGTWKQFVSATGAFRRLRSLLKDIPAPAHRTSLPAPRGLIDVEGLSAKAPFGVTPILQNLNFTVEPGSVVGIVGASGAGKSTLARLLVGAWEPTVGKVRLDDADIHIWNRDELGPFIGYLPQDIELFEGTVAENIARFGSTDSELVVAAAQRAGAHNMIARLPQGYETTIGSGGAVLSGGQRQRIGLARAMYGSPSLVVLDEPNANLDQDGERALMEAIVTMREAGTTVIIISHKAGILEVADRLIVLNEGKLLAVGPRKDILHRLVQLPNATVATGRPALQSVG